MNNAFWFCKEKVASDGSENYYAMLSLNPWQKQATTALLAFAHEIHSIALGIREPEVRYRQLQFWFDECQRAFRGQPQHPVMQAIKQIFAGIELPYDAFMQLLFAAQQRITSPIIPAIEAGSHFQQSFHIIPLLTQYVYGAQNQIHSDFAARLSEYLGRVHILRNLSQYTLMNLHYFSSLHISGATQPSLDIPGFFEELQQFITETQQMLPDVLKLLPKEAHFSQRFLIIQAKMQQRTLEKFYRNIQKGKIVFPVSLPLINLWYARKYLREEIKKTIRVKN